MVSGVCRMDVFLREVARYSKGRPPPPPRHVEPSQLDLDAQEICLELSKCSTKLSELTKLARKRSIYVDHTAEIECLTSDVKKSITVASTKIDALDAKIAGTKHRNDQLKQHYENLLATLRKQLCDLTKDLKDALYQRAQVMIQQEVRRKMYSHTDLDHTLTSSGHGRRRFTVQQAAEGAQQMDLERSVIADAKAEALANVQRAIGELTQIFQRMTTLVTQQDEMIQRIDADTEDSLDNVISAQSELSRYYKRISSNRTLLLKIFCILVAFVIFYILFLT
ncbi:Integral membrane protein sed5 [Babesia sp. Xinjiang]|uniref:Integral membrane protein sed5 n=1 Tax=Babesia sp. Xinjiang TaxID=462227 RepID=UPI000A21698E|nr:Integral membrane protein sed5 [Babesia sp. Xinjiang]ORM41919.1 Integral membrane protein sed5 [Babesia sp. Xinjiang]